MDLSSATNRWYAHAIHCRLRAALTFVENAADACADGHKDFEGWKGMDAEQAAAGGSDYLEAGDTTCICDRSVRAMRML